MKNMNKVIGVMMMVLMGASSAMAEGKAHGTGTGINKRITNQKKRISHKLEKGKITQDEANKLNSNVDAVQAKETEMKKDGKLTKDERKDLRQELNKNSQEIKNTGAKVPAVPSTPTGN